MSALKYDARRFILACHTAMDGCPRTSAAKERAAGEATRSAGRNGSNRSDLHYACPLFLITCGSLPVQGIHLSHVPSLPTSTTGTRHRNAKASCPCLSSYRLVINTSSSSSSSFSSSLSTPPLPRGTLRTQAKGVVFFGGRRGAGRQPSWDGLSYGLTDLSPLSRVAALHLLVGLFVRHVSAASAQRVSTPQVSKSARS